MQKDYKMEIGSEFWDIELGSTKSFFLNNNFENIAYLSSGRTALDYILRDIFLKKNNSSLSAYLPSYCCDSMIVPFLDNGISVSFYDVIIKQEKIYIRFDYNNIADIVLIPNYFGYNNGNFSKVASSQVKKKKIVIQDVTHCLIDEDKYLKDASYIFASIRKWSGFIGGGIAISNEDKFTIPLPKSEHDVFNNQKKIGMKEKSSYMAGKKSDKGYLLNFSNAEFFLEKNYNSFKMISEDRTNLLMWNVEKVKEKRKENAQFIYKQLEGNDNFKLLFNYDKTKDIPLFVPILLKDNLLRNNLRNFLIENEIYCPIHWPISNYHKMNDFNQDIYTRGLSLICDQRYSLNDMKRQTECIWHFFEVKKIVKDY